MSAAFADLASRVAATPAGGVITLDPPGKEFKGPVVLTKSVTLRGQGGTIWAERGPVVIVESAGVVLSDVNIEVTGPAVGGAPGVALAATREPKLDRVTVRGHVAGVAGEAGDWQHPTILRLGRILANRPHTFTVTLVVPVACRLESTVAGVTVSPAALPAGAVPVTITIEALADGIRLRGALLLRTPNLTRRVELSGHVCATGAGVTTGTGQSVFTPGDLPATPAVAAAAPAGVPVAKLVAKPAPVRPDSQADVVLLVPAVASKPVPVADPVVVLAPPPPPAPVAPPVPVAVPLPPKARYRTQGDSLPIGVFGAPPTPTSTPVAPPGQGTDAPRSPDSTPVVPPPSDPLVPKKPGFRKIDPPPSGGLFG